MKREAARPPGWHLGRIGYGPDFAPFDARPSGRLGCHLCEGRSGQSKGRRQGGKPDVQVPLRTHGFAWLIELATARSHPGWPAAALGLADVTMARGLLPEALRRYEAVIRAEPENLGAVGRYGLALGLAQRYPEARVQLARALAKIVGVAELHRGMAEVEAALGNPEASVSHGRAALRLMPDYTDAANNLAWTLATSHEPRVRDPLDAIQLIEFTALESGDASLLDTLAAAYASAGRYDAAIAAANRAADASRNPSLERNIRARLALYREGRPYIEPIPQP